MKNGFGQFAWKAPRKGRKKSDIFFKKRLYKRRFVWYNIRCDRNWGSGVASTLTFLSVFGN